MDHQQSQSHVAQQSRRDRLRAHHFQDNLERFPVYPEMNSDHGRCYEPVVLSSGMINFAADLTGCSMDHQPDPPGCSNWRSVGCDWNHPLSGGGLIINNSTVSGSMHCNNNNMQKHFTSPLFQSSLHDVVTIASAGGNINDLAPLPSYEFDHDAAAWSVQTDQGLSLTLSSNPPPHPHFGQGFVSPDLHSDNLDSIMPNSLISRGSSGKSVKDMNSVVATLTHPSTGPLGPFTGYATILKCSKFLKPAQQLLDEFCSVVKTCEDPGRISGKASMLADAFDGTDHQALVRSKGCGSSAASSSTLHSSNNPSAGECTVRDRDRESCQPEYQQKKAKLVCMHEEVGRRYKQYHQQMQMVVSSFESVAGLSDATPYVSLALKTVSRHFRCLRNAITDQLGHIKKALGEDFLSPTTGASSTKGDTSALRLKYKEHNFQNHKSAGGNVGFLEPQQHAWRPQRGLPERSVAILRTWLFEHFLHPYPTDTDKHMLATQTGLSRNQVSNWFINARVRVWKPMVEEIHMLETNGLAPTDKNEESRVGEGTSCSNGEETANKLDTNTLTRKHLEFPGMGCSSDIGDGLSSEQWSQEKRIRVECQAPPSMDRSFMGFMPHQRGGLEMGGLGAVSLTLGLRHSTESAQHQLQEDELQRQFGGHMFHDFVG